MKALIDLQTHTIESGHAYRTIKENVEAASKAGLKYIGLSEHAPNMPASPHAYYFQNVHVIPKEIDGVRVIQGIEANIIDYDGNKVLYNKEDLINITHAYAITIHKAQGSEFDYVIMPISLAYRRMLYNKLLYTGVSRAKKSQIIIGSKEAYMIYNALAFSYAQGREDVVSRNYRIIRNDVITIAAEKYLVGLNPDELSGFLVYNYTAYPMLSIFD